MVIAGGGGGGHHHHHHHGGGHHHGGAIYARSWGYPYRYPPPEVLVVTQTPAPCPQTWAPVLANDGKLYRNACAANRAGVLPVRSARKHELTSQAVLGAVSPAIAVGGLALAAVALAIGYGAIMRDHRRRRR